MTTYVCRAPGCGAELPNHRFHWCPDHADEAFRRNQRRYKARRNLAVYARTAKPEEIDRWVAELAQLTGLRKGGAA